MITVDKIQNPSHLFLLLTEACNFQCIYCFVNQHPKHMTFETAYKALTWLAENNPTEQLSISLFGGEPTLRWNEVIEPLVIHAKHVYGNRVSFNMTTNALLLNEDRIAFMKKYNIDFLFSFDGCKECMDINRPLPGNASSFDAVSPKIPMLLELNPNATMRSTIYHSTVQYVFESYKFAIENGFKHTFAAIDTFGEWTEKEFEILKSELFKVADLYLQTCNEGTPVVFDPLLSQYNKLDRTILPEKSCSSDCSNCTPFALTKCGVGGNKGLAVTPSGDIYTCQEVASTADKHRFYVGNLQTGRDKEKVVDLLNTIDKDKIRCSKKDYCKKCNIKHLCDGGCLARNYEQAKDINIMPYAQCRYENIMYDVNLYIKSKRNNTSGNITKDEVVTSSMFS